MNMKAKQIPGEKGRFTVHSEAEDNAEHVVDMTANKGNGECSCRWFEIKCGPNFHHNGGKIVHYGRDKDGRVNQDATYCKHIDAVRHHILDSTLPTMFVVDIARPKPQTIRETHDGLPF
jgi:hypothetical protein